MEVLIAQVIALLALSAVSILLIISGYREYRLNKKVELLKYMMDKGYENDKIDLNNYIK